MTTDRETIRGWAGEHDAVPVRYTGVEGESGTLRIVPENEVEASHEPVEWDEFHDELDRGDHVVVYHGTAGAEPFEVTSRQRALSRTTTDDEEVEEALLEGETITSEVTETTVVERTIVEEATVESEVVDREIVSQEVVDAELLTRDVVECTLLGAGGEAYGEGAEGSFSADEFAAGGRSTYDDQLRVELTVDEGWTVTKEVVEALDIESRVVDTEATETDTVEADTVESSVDVEGVQRTVVESDLIDTDAGVEVIESGHVESEFREGEVVATRLLERKTVEEEISLERRYEGEITEAETLRMDTVSREVIESDIVGEEDVEAEAIAASGTGAAAGEEGAIAVGDVDDEVVMPSADDEGKTVVDATGREIGMVVDVEGDTVYVEPEPSMAEKIATALGWGDADEDDYPVSPDRIARITDDRVELVSVEPEEAGEHHDR